MERALIEKYLAGENSSQLTQQLRLLLESKPSAERSAEEQALLLMLTGLRKEPDDDLFGADYSDEYEKVVRRNTLHKLWKTTVATMAIAACVIVVWFMGSGEWEVKREVGTEGGQEWIFPPSRSPQGERGGEKMVNGQCSMNYPQSESDSTTAVPNPEQPMKEHVKPEVNHYAWAKALMESYREEDLGEMTETADDMARQEMEWAQTEREE